MHINRPVAVHMGQMGPNGSNNASSASSSSLLFSILQCSNQGKPLMLSLDLWPAVIYLYGSSIHGRER